LLEGEFYRARFLDIDPLQGNFRAMADRTVQLVVHYDGARFAGWQRQPVVRTVQGELEQAFGRLIDRPVAVTGAGRTDRGVHARGQVAHAKVPERWTMDRLRRGLNALLPDDIWVAAVYEMVDRFHARYSAISRAYSYYVGTDDGAWSPFRRRYEWRVPWKVDGAALHEAARGIVGEHTFRGFAVQGTAPETDDHRCIVERAEWRPRGRQTGEGEMPAGAQEGEGYVFTIEANRFLHHMVRFLVGTMLDIAAGHRTMESLGRLLEAQDNSTVSPPAPPHALFLDRVTYPADLYLNRS
jgi:tRNA pseudouridine38-40 synthase